MSHLETMRTVLVIYTGGTIGMTRDKVSGALVPLDFAQVAKHVPELEHAGIRVEAVSFDVPMDSSDVSPRHWRSLATTVAECYNRFDGIWDTYPNDHVTSGCVEDSVHGCGKKIMDVGKKIKS